MKKLILNLILFLVIQTTWAFFLVPTLYLLFHHCKTKLQEYLHFLCQFYSVLLPNFFNSLIKFNYIPPIMKLNVNIALPKYDSTVSSETKQNPSKYRYIGLQTSIFKIMDHVINSTLDSWQLSNQIIYKSQGGFQKQRGTMEQLFILQHMFYCTRNFYTAFIDLRKAYDSVWINGLLSKLKKYNLPNHLLHTLTLSLKNSQCVNRFNDTYGVIYNRTDGLPQGAISSPLLFNLFINDLIKDLLDTKVTISSMPMCINNLLFADDIALFAESTSDLSILVNTANAYFNKWKLQINVTKSNILTKANQPLKVNHFNDLLAQLTLTHTYKYLGLPICPIGINSNKYLNLSNDDKSDLEEPDDPEDLEESEESEKSEESDLP